MKKLLAVLALTIVTLAACGGDDGGGDGADASEDVSDVVTDDLSDAVTDDVSDDLSDDVSADDPTPAQELRAFLDENYPDYSALATGIGTTEIAPDDIQVTLTLDQTTDADTAVAVCEATLEFAEDAEIVEIEIEVEDQEDTVLATGGYEDGCEAA